MSQQGYTNKTPIGAGNLSISTSTFKGYGWNNDGNNNENNLTH